MFGSFTLAYIQPVVKACVVVRAMVESKSGAPSRLDDSSIKLSSKQAGKLFPLTVRRSEVLSRKNLELLPHNAFSNALGAAMWRQRVTFQCTADAWRGVGRMRLLVLGASIANHDIPTAYFCHNCSCGGVKPAFKASYIGSVRGLCISCGTCPPLQATNSDQQLADN